MASPDEWREAEPYVEEAKQRLWARYRDDPNVVGIAFGPPVRGGERLDEPACVVYVARKLPERELAPDRVVPRTVEVRGQEVRTDVVESGRFYAYEFTGRERPAIAGISIGHAHISAGTLGCLVRDNDVNGRLSILSNNHVLANSNNAKAGDFIYQPGPADAHVQPGNAVGTLTRWVPISFGSSVNRVDCAVADVRIDCDISDDVKGAMTSPSRDQPAIGLLFAGGASHTVLNPINDVASRLRVEMTAGPQARSAVTAADVVPPGAPVQKTGRTTEYTTGRVLAINGILEVNYGDGRIAAFDGQIITTPMACGGDSGSVVCRGGTGVITKPECLVLCPFLGAGEDLTGIPFTQEWVSIRHVRDRYLSTSLIGRWLIDLMYENQESALRRAREAQVPPQDRALAQALYATYGTELKLAAADPDRSDLVVTDQHLLDAESALASLHKYLTPKEQEAAKEIRDIGFSLRGKTARELITMLDDQELYDRLRRIVDDTGSLVDPHR
ncbi:hypothetical protein [Actinomadura sp. KC06]|uniref:hypothetical protein n=1 Tax=Actinomadura sp. KC06 TaxID=2530369 RepID=UPI001A9CEA18|nr:hypothetical protein [Actinomadura sp. KC06]